jgi:hypothetical protein
VEREQEGNREQELERFRRDCGAIVPDCAPSESTEAFSRMVQLSLQRNDLANMLQGMRLHREQTAYQQEACHAIAKLASTKMDEIAKYGGIHRILDAMETHPKHCGVQAQALGAIKALAHTTDMRWSIVSAGAVAIIVCAMDMHPDQEHVLEQAVAALLAICWSDKELQKRIQHEVGAQRVTEAISHLPTNNTKFWGRQLIQKLQ